MLLGGIYPSKTRYSSNFSSFLQVSDTKAAAAETQKKSRVDPNISAGQKPLGAGANL